MKNEFEAEEVETLVLIAVGVYKVLKNSPENKLEELAVHLYSTVGHLSDSADAAHLKNEASKKNVQRCLSRENTVKLVGKFLRFPAIADGTDLHRLIQTFLDKENQAKVKIEQEKTKFDAAKLKKLEEIVGGLNRLELANPAFKEMVESVVYTFNVLKNDTKEKGLFLTKEQLEEVLEAARHAKSLESVKPSINAYLGIRAEIDDDDEDEEIRQFLESDVIFPNESLPNLLSKYHFVLLGKPGVGKKLFVNSFKYALLFPSMFSAIKSTVPFTVVFPVQFSAYAENQLKPFEVDFAPENPWTEDSVSFTVRGTEFKFTVIDLPILDERTAATFRERFGHEEIHAILFFLQASDCRYESSLLQGFGLFPPKMAEKTQFVVTSSQICNFRPGNADAIIQQICNSVPELDWSEKQTVYVDNEGFRLLCMAKRVPKLKNGNQKRCAKSWKETQKQIFSLISRIKPDTD